MNYMTVGEGYKALIEATGEPSIIDGVNDPAAISVLNKATAEAFSAGGELSLNSQLNYSPNDQAALTSQVLLGTISPEEFGVKMQSSFDQLKKLQG